MMRDKQEIRSRQAELAKEKIEDDAMEAMEAEGIYPWGRTDHDCLFCFGEMKQQNGEWYCDKPGCWRDIL